LFRTAELEKKLTKKEFQERRRALREALLEAQNDVRESDFRVMVLFGGVDGAGKSEVVNLLNAWMDPRWLVTRAFDEPTQEERERPPYWRFWRDLPGRGRIGLLLSAWYSQPLLARAYGGKASDLEQALDDIVAFEQQLAEDGALILKFWLHLGKRAQERRFKKLEKDPLQSWRVTERDWDHWRRYDDFVGAAERTIVRTSTGDAAWHIVEGADIRYSSVRVASLLLEAIRDRVESDRGARRCPPTPAAPATSPPRSTVLDTLDMSLALGKPEYRQLLATHQGRLNQLQRAARERGTSTIVVLEGWDASGKGGAIRRINAALDARNVQVIPIGPPTDEERAHHYLWRFWRHLSRAGRMTLFDRSWYGRVLVERVEGFAREDEWRRAYAEINHFERQLVEHGIVLVKLWMHVTKDEQLGRFQEREQTPYKRWKLTDEDWRNRERWDDYALAAHDMIERTDTHIAPWVLVEANDKLYARVKVLETLCRALESRVGPPERHPEKKRRKA
jgi:polyphosphate:AMP phosphotransferase